MTRTSRTPRRPVRLHQRPKQFAFDFDGVIARYSGFKGHYHVGPPIPGIVRAIKLLKKQGHIVIIYSTRSTSLLKRYCKRYGIPVDYINENPMYTTKNPGKVVATAYVDDRAVCYTGQSPAVLVRQLTAFRTYWER